MTKVLVRPKPRPVRTTPVDLRTPAGRVLPY